MRGSLSHRGCPTRRGELFHGGADGLATSASLAYLTMPPPRSEFSAPSQVLIITNSDEGWVRHSCGRWLPNLLPLLQRSRVVSARTEYASFYPAQRTYCAVCQKLHTETLLGTDSGSFIF